MPHTDLLLTLAEVAVAFAGFASLVSIMSVPRSEGYAIAQSILFRAMILMSLTVLAFSLVPFLTHGFGLSSEVSWLIASGLFLLMGSIGLFVGWRYIMKAGPVIYRAKGFSGLVFLVDGPALIGLIFLVSNILGFSSVYISDSYIVALLLFLVGSGVCFAAILFSHIHPINSVSKTD